VELGSGLNAQSREDKSRSLPRLRPGVLDLLGRGAGHVREAGSKSRLSVGCCMLVDQRGLRRRVAEAVHEFSHGGAGLGGHRGAGVAEVVESEVGSADLLAGALEDFVHAAVVHVVPLGVGEHEAVGAGSCIAFDLRPDQWHEVRRDRYVSDAGQ
jgi:hypothetical protein